MDSEKKVIVRQIYKGTYFRVSALILSRLLSVVKISVFARMFLPEIIGISNLAITCIYFMAIFGNFGFSQYLIKSNDDSHEIKNTVFSISLIINASLIIITFLTAGIFNIIFKIKLNTYIYLLLIILLEIPLKLPVSLWEKKLQFGYSSYVILIQELFVIASTVIIQLVFNLDVWSILIGYLTGFIFSIIYIWIFTKYKPGLKIEKKYTGKIFSFGTPLMLNGLNGYIMSKGDNLIVAKLWGTKQLAYYNFAWQLPLLISMIVQSLDSMLLPVYSKFNDKKTDLNKLFNLHNKLWALFGTFFGLMLLLYADVIVKVLYGQKWIDVIPLLRIMSLSFILRYCTGYGYDHLAVIRGRTKYLMKWGFVNTFFLLTLGTYLIYKFGPIGGAWFWVIQCIILIPLIRLPLIYSEMKSFDFLKEIWQPILSGIAAVISGYLILKYAGINILTIILSILIFIIVYLIVLFLLDKKLFDDIKKLITMISSIEPERNKEQQIK